MKLTVKQLQKNAYSFTLRLQGLVNSNDLLDIFIQIDQSIQLSIYVYVLDHLKNGLGEDIFSLFLRLLF